MKKVFLFTVLSLCSAVAFAQFAIISDKDGYVNVRSSPEIKKDNIIDTLHNGRLVYSMEELAEGLNVGNWVNVDFKDSRNGYVYKNRIKYISDYQSISEIFEDENKLILSGNNITVEIKIRMFDSTKHTITYANDDGYIFVDKIDGKKYWGTDGELPKYEYEYISITMNGLKYFLPNEAIENLFECRRFSEWANYDNENDILYIQSMNSDGAGAYFVAWKIEKSIYKERLIIYGF